MIRTRATTDEAALKAAIVFAPEDDLPRLVYADWLEEHGQPERAEFIRLEIAIDELRRARGGTACANPKPREPQRSFGRSARGRPCGLCDGCALLNQRNDLILAESESRPNRVEWAGELAAVLDRSHSGGFEYDRGFVYALWTRAGDLLGRGVAAALGRAAPLGEVWCAEQTPAWRVDGRHLEPAAIAHEDRPHAWWTGRQPADLTFAAGVAWDDQRLSWMPRGVFTCLPANFTNGAAGSEIYVAGSGEVRAYANLYQARYAAARAWARYCRKQARLPAWRRLLSIPPERERTP